MTIEKILEEIKDVPQDRLEELYQFVQTLTPSAITSESYRNKILSFSGAFGDMKDSDFDEFVQQTNKIRKNLFDREGKL